VLWNWYVNFTLFITSHLQLWKSIKYQGAELIIHGTSVNLNLTTPNRHSGTRIWWKWTVKIKFQVKWRLSFFNSQLSSCRPFFNRVNYNQNITVKVVGTNWNNTAIVMNNIVINLLLQITTPTPPSKIINL
jgi:hypothetical protein